MFRICVLLVVLLLGCSAWAAEHLKDPARADSWALEVAGSAKATLQADAGAIRVDVTATSSEPWHVQLLQTGKPLQPGRHYILRFAAKASSPRIIKTYAQTGAPSYDHIWPDKPIYLPTEYKTFTLDISVSRDPNGKGRIPVFALGERTGSIWIKNASLRDASDVSALVAPSPSRAADGNLLTEAGDPASWTLEPHEQAAADIIQEDGGLRLDVTHRSGQRWHLQLYQVGDRLTPGKTYLLKFGARTTLAQKIAVVTAQEAKTPWRMFGGSTDIEPGTAWRQYTLRFTVSRDAASPIRSPIFQFGDLQGSVWLRNITLTEAPAN